MQANNSPEWKDDADFWNDAWKDMQQRLDAESGPKRRPVLLWWWLGGFAALLVSGLLTANMLMPVDEVVSQEKTDVVLAEVTDELTSGDASETDLPRAVAKSNIANRQSHIAYPETPSPLPQAAAQLTPNPKNLSPTPLRRRGAIENAPRFEKEKVETTEVDLQRAAAQSNIAYRQSHIEYPPPPPTDREDLLALAQIPVPEMVPLRSALELPVVSPVKQKRKSHIDLLAGGTVSSAFEKPGYFAGLSYTLPTRGRISFPISLRYRYDALEINEINEQRLGQPTTVTDPQNDFNAAEAARQLVSDLAIGNFNELRTSGVELQVGVAWRVGSRLSLSANGGVEYFLAARGPSLSSGDNSFADLSGTNRYVNLEIGNLSFTNFDQAGIPTGNPTGTPAENFSAPVGVDRLAFRTGLALDYRLTNRFTVVTGGQYLLSPIYREQAAGLRRGQLEVGLKWRMR